MSSLHFSCNLPLICLSTNQNIQLIHSLLIRIEWTTGNGILMSSSHWPIYNKFPPGTNADIAMHAHYIVDIYLERGPTWQAVCSSRRDSCPCLGPARTLTAGAEAEGGLRLRSRCWVPGRDSNNGSQIFHNHGEGPY